uniref:Uncharacterized protein n=1 Tax=Glossina austeni TaxID=7395 RepID=A0A1A9V3X8_GLOAU
MSISVGIIINVTTATRAVAGISIMNHNSLTNINLEVDEKKFLLILPHNLHIDNNQQSSLDIFEIPNRVLKSTKLTDICMYKSNKCQNRYFQLKKIFKQRHSVGFVIIESVCNSAKNLTDEQLKLQSQCVFSTTGDGVILLLLPLPLFMGLFIYLLTQPSERNDRNEKALQRTAKCDGWKL